MLSSALSLLRERVPGLSQAGLLRLLEASFRFLSVDELRPVPLAVLERLNPVPPGFLKQARAVVASAPSAITQPACPQLATDMELFRLLPRSVQRQVWELDAALFRRHAAPSVAAYAEETATVLRELEMARPTLLRPLGASDAHCRACAWRRWWGSRWAPPSRRAPSLVPRARCPRCRARRCARPAPACSAW